MRTTTAAFSPLPHDSITQTHDGEGRVDLDACHVAAQVQRHVVDDIERVGNHMTHS